MGTTTIFNIIEYSPAANFCEILYPELAEYELAFQISIKLRDAGRIIQAIDILIASMCINREFTLVTKDNDFSRIKEIEKSFQVKIVK